MNYTHFPGKHIIFLIKHISFIYKPHPFPWKTDLSSINKNYPSENPMIFFIKKILLKHPFKTTLNPVSFHISKIRCVYVCVCRVYNILST